MNNFLNDINKIFRDVKKEELLNINFLENNLIVSLGLNNENLNEQPKELEEFFGGGIGLKIWQYPNQFSKYLVLLSSYAKKINSYLEIGCRHGGTFVLTSEYLNKINNSFSKSVAIDIIDKSELIAQYLKNDRIDVSFVQINSHSDEFSNFITKRFYDLIFIDGDHSYEGVKKDAETTRDFCNIQVFHDITNDACLGVGEYWDELKNSHKDVYHFFDFTDQYESVKGSFLGIGVAIRKKWITILI